MRYHCFYIKMSNIIFYITRLNLSSIWQYTRYKKNILRRKKIALLQKEFLNWNTWHPVCMHFVCTQWNPISELITRSSMQIKWQLSFINNFTLKFLCLFSIFMRECLNRLTIPRVHTTVLVWWPVHSHNSCKDTISFKSRIG